MDGKIKAPPSVGRMWLVGLSYFAIAFHPFDGASDGNAKIFNKLSAIAVATLRETDPSPTSSISRKRPSRACADGPPAVPLIEVLRTRLARSRTDAIDRQLTSRAGPRPFKAPAARTA
jgi:hypothetical protein